MIHGQVKFSDLGNLVRGYEAAVSLNHFGFRTHPPYIRDLAMLVVDRIRAFGMAIRFGGGSAIGE